MTNKFINFENIILTETEFISLFSDIYEHSDWVIKNIINNNKSVPKTIEELEFRMKGEVNKSKMSEKLKLLNYHPELGIRKNNLKNLTASSKKEQKSAGLDNCSNEEFVLIKSLNIKYKEKFKFPFIIAVKGLNRDEIILSMKNRMKNTYDKEFSTAMNEVHKIAKIRLRSLSI